MLKIAPLVLLFAIVPAGAEVLFVNASERGSVDSDGSSNGASASNFFFAGFLFVQERDWFEFPIPALSGTLVSGTLNLDQPQFGHQGGQLLYSVYALGSQPANFSDVNANAATLYGSVSTDAATDGTAVSITLDAAALAAIAGSQRGDFFIGGIDSGENSGSFAGDFASSNNHQTFLELTTVPEPFLLSAMVLMILAVTGLRCRRALLAETGLRRGCPPRTNEKIGAGTRSLMVVAR